MALIRRDEETWGWHFLYVMEQGFDPDYTIADGGSGLSTGQKAVMSEAPCHGDGFHIQQQFEQVANSLRRQANGTTTRHIKLEHKIENARLTGPMPRKLIGQLVYSKRRDRELFCLCQDIKTFLQWMFYDVLELSGPLLDVRQALFDYIVRELQHRENKNYSAIRKLRKALYNQRDDLLAFAGALAYKPTQIAQRFNLPLQVVCDGYLLYRKHHTSNAYWERWNHHFYSQTSGKFYGLLEAVGEAFKQTPRASSLVENLNSRLRNYFFLRRRVGDSYLGLLQFFLNHRCFIRSEIPE
ncbi:MAG: hypothetical protein AAGC93_31730 [Cyanobacteria bacterium P01_F01_bin.53]